MVEGVYPFVNLFTSDGFPSIFGSYLRALSYFGDYWVCLFAIYHFPF